MKTQEWKDLIYVSGGGKDFKAENRLAIPRYPYYILRATPLGDTYSSEDLGERPLSTLFQGTKAAQCPVQSEKEATPFPSFMAGALLSPVLLRQLSLTNNAGTGVNDPIRKFGQAT